jgi:hypothetical protein
MENKVYVMTAKQARKMFPIDKEKFRQLKALQDAGIEPYFDDEHPDIDVYCPNYLQEMQKRHQKKEGILTKIFNRLRSKPKQPQPQASLP